MAKFCTTAAAVALFCLFTLSHAAASPDTDESTALVSLPLFEAAESTLRLPSEPIDEKTDHTSDVVGSTVLPSSNRIDSRPVNRRFRVRSNRPCHHHFKFHPTMRENEEIPYGNDMLVSTGENSDFQEALHGDFRRIPGRWMRKHHHHQDEDSDSDDDDDRLQKIALKRYRKKLRKHFRNEEEEKRGGFMKRVRKFLNHYF